MRDMGKDLRNLQLALLESNDKPIYYISKIHGNKYIVPQKEYEKLNKENIEMKKVLEIIWNKKVDLWGLLFSKILEDYNTYIMKKGGFILTQEEFELLKRCCNG